LHQSSLLLYTNPEPPYTYTLSLHDALPILRRTECAIHCLRSGSPRSWPHRACTPRTRLSTSPATKACRCRRSSSRSRPTTRARRSEEHTSELQSPYDLVCRLLLEKKNKVYK